jgi:hypothetical protein
LLGFRPILNQDGRPSVRRLTVHDAQGLVRPRAFI